jgi:hypothetical protein
MCQKRIHVKLPEELLVNRYGSYHLFVNGRKELGDLEDPMWRRWMEKFSVEQVFDYND